jgi:hypothetical protein
MREVNVDKLLLLILFLIPSLANAQWQEARMGPAMVGGSGAAAAGAWLTSCTGTTETHGTYVSSSYPVGSPVTTTGGGTVKKLSVRIEDVQTCTKGWIALYASGGGTLHTHAHYTSFATGWNDLVVPDYSASATTTYEIYFQCDASVHAYAFSDGNDGWYAEDIFSDDEEPGIAGRAADTSCLQLRAWIE